MPPRDDSSLDGATSPWRSFTPRARSPRVAEPMRRPAARAEWRDWARTVLANDDAWMIVDTETTGTHNEADIIEFAAVTPLGKVLADCLIRPIGSIPPYITQLTGITNAMVTPAPRFPFAYAETLWPHLSTRGILAYNAPFDVRMIRQNVQRHCRRAWEPVEQACLMRAYGKWRGECYPRGHGWAGRVMVHKLDVACRQLGIPHDHAHRALDDCLVTVKLLRAMAE
ncbi:MAG TPA: 3'-5' exonuclease [Ktedonobacterales bacterium]|nr:3'-5' exonuclease [Ktedonobacterales bacterium]